MGKHKYKQYKAAMLAHNKIPVSRWKIWFATFLMDLRLWRIYPRRVKHFCFLNADLDIL